MLGVSAHDIACHDHVACYLTMMTIFQLSNGQDFLERGDLYQALAADTERRFSWHRRCGAPETDRDVYIVWCS